MLKMTRDLLKASVNWHNVGILFDTSDNQSHFIIDPFSKFPTIADIYTWKSFQYNVVRGFFLKTNFQSSKYVCFTWRQHLWFPVYYDSLWNNMAQGMCACYFSYYDAIWKFLYVVLRALWVLMWILSCHLSVWSLL